MITRTEDYESGATKLLAYLSANTADIEAAEREVFSQVYAGVEYGDVTSEQDKLLFAKSLKYFTFCQFTGSVNARIKIGGEMTDTATSYGQVDTRYLLNVWAEGVRQAKRDAAAIRVLFPSFQVIAKIKI